MKSAVNASNNLRNSLNGTTSGMKNFGNQSSGVGGVITSLASKAAVAVGAFVGVRQAIEFGKLIDAAIPGKTHIIPHIIFSSINYTS